ncbi:hypothetical protein ADUPG1_010462, partial [Aduncisulcus paluster]
GLNGGAPQKVHISRLRHFQEDEPEEDQKLSQALDEEEYQIDRILSHRGRRGKRSREFLVSWVGYGEDQNVWLPYKEVKFAEAVDDYLKEHPKLKEELGDEDG